MNMAVEFEEDTKSLSDYIAMLKRRRKQIVISASIVFLLIAVIAILWPPIYKASATILIEEQEIPKDLVRSTVTSYAAQQIQIISQRVLTLKNIMELIEKYELYSEAERKRLTTTELAEEFRNELMSLDLIDAEVVDPRTGRPTVATIAFSLSFKHGNPSKAQKIANELVSLYLNENLRLRSEKSVNTSAFLKAEAESLAEKLTELEANLAVFKEENKTSLPEYSTYNLNMLDRVERELSNNTFRLSELKKAVFDYESQLAQLSPYAPTVLADGQRVLSDYDRLKALESEYNRKAAIYNEEHPDLKRIKRELAELKAAGAELTANDRSLLIKAEQDKLAELKNKYTADHPQVANQQRYLAELLSSSKDNQQNDGSNPAADNPAYVLLETKLKAAKVEINTLLEKNAELKQKRDNYEDLILKAPTVEKDYRSLERDYINAQAKYQEIKAKQMEAELSQNLEEGRQGERFTLIQPPILPQKPVSPNRTAVILMGAILALGIGVGLAILLEMLDQSVRGEKQLAGVLGAAPLASLPYIYIDDELQKNYKQKYYIIGGLFAVGLLFLLSIHLLWKPLDVIWFILMRKAGM